MSTVNDPNAGVAFALVLGAGLATALGASVVFFPSLVKLASRRVLASALGLSAGVMTYVSFVEIFTKSHVSFKDAGESDKNAYIFSTLCFFGGVGIMLLVDLAVRILGGHGHHHGDDHSHAPQEGEEGQAEDDDVQAPHCLACSPDPVGDLEILQHQADELIAAEKEKEEVMEETGEKRGEEKQTEGLDEEKQGYAAGEEQTYEEETKKEEEEDKLKSSVEEDVQKEKVDKAAEEENRKLVKMGVNTALAIGLHNFPEGLATFVAALNDPRVGAVLAIAIGIHNIPEGLCVALPIYYATGNRCKAFGWALLSGASEPIAALLGWAILANSFSDRLYAILFGLVAGMMVIISTRELLPTAHRYDPEDTVVTFSYIGGMAILALSLVLFQL